VVDSPVVADSRAAAPADSAVFRLESS
jgi:hypothetical protein